MSIPIQIITIDGVNKKCKIMIEKVSSENFRAYIAVKYEFFEPFLYFKENSDKLILLDHCKNMFTSQYGGIKTVDNEVSDIYSSKEIKDIFNCHVSES